MDLDGGGGNDLTPLRKEASEAALELMKQLITLSSGLLALSAAFLDKFGAIGIKSLIPILFSWLLLIVSIVAALDVISAIVKSRLTPEHPWHTGRGLRSARISKWSFVVGFAAFASFGLTAAISRSGQADGTPEASVTIIGGSNSGQSPKDSIPNPPTKPTSTPTQNKGSPPTP